MENEILKIDNVSKNFGALKAINDLSFNVFEFEIFGIAGPNGSGKSTLFNIITSIPFRSDRGNIYFNNQDITKIKPYKFINEKNIFIGHINIWLFMLLAKIFK